MSKPNVLIIHTDQQRYDSLGCTGNPHAQTPHLDALAAEGTVFTRHFVANSACCPSRASLLTGLYPPGHNLWVNGVPLPRREYDLPRMDAYAEPLQREVPTAADVFAAAGYETYCVGKLHLAPNKEPDDPTLPYAENRRRWSRGELDDWHGPYYGFQTIDMTSGHGAIVGGHHAVWMKRNHPDEFARIRAEEAEVGKPVTGIDDVYLSPVSNELNCTSWLADRALSRLTERQDSEKPFFMFLGFPDPHHPVTPSREIGERFAEQSCLPIEDPSGEGLADSPVYQRLQEQGQWLHPVGHLPEDERRLIIQYTYALVHQIDCAVGRVIAGLKELGEWDNTIVVFTSDHGDFLCDHGLFRKHEVGARQLLHTPLIVRTPGERRWAERANHAVSNCDVLPTLTALAGVDAPRMDGSNLFGSSDDEALAFTYNWQWEDWLSNYTACDERYRYTYYPRMNYAELFDHRDDPGETRNLALESGHKDRCRCMRQAIGEHYLSVSAPMLGRIGPY